MPGGRGQPARCKFRLLQPTDVTHGHAASACGGASSGIGLPPPCVAATSHLPTRRGFLRWKGRRRDADPPTLPGQSDACAFGALENLCRAPASLPTATRRSADTPARSRMQSRRTTAEASPSPRYARSRAHLATLRSPELDPCLACRPHRSSEGFVHAARRTVSRLPLRSSSLRHRARFEPAPPPLDRDWHTALAHEEARR